jgi:hypothetical protein
LVDARSCAGWAIRVAVLIPHSEERNLFLTAKNNLGKDPGRLACRIRFVGEQDDIPAPYLVWEDKPVAITANEALTAANGDARDRTATRLLAAQLDSQEEGNAHHCAPGASAPAN